MTTSELLEIFPDEDYRFSLRVRRGSFAEFFGPSPDAQAILNERSSWLDRTPPRCVAWRNAAAPLLEATLEMIAQTGALEASALSRVMTEADGFSRCASLGRVWEPDFLLLARTGAGNFQLEGACVCFPSSWDLSGKIGRPLDFIHDTVPQLNRQIGDQIGTFLSRMKPGVSWLRTNWGLTRSPELNQHPARMLPRLDASVDAAEVWLRVERQALVSLPRSDGLLFGIRIAKHPLSQLVAEPVVAARLARALRTMPEEIARYKGIVEARTQLLMLLEADGSAVGS